MNVLLSKAGWSVRFAQTREEITRIQRLRGLCFRGGGLDEDALDDLCHHVGIYDAGGDLHGCFRMKHVLGCEIEQSYSAQFYGLDAMRAFPGAMLELGRFCLNPEMVGAADVLRLAWGAITRYVDAQGVGLLFGCSSFQGTDPSVYRASFDLLKARHLAPEIWMPARKMPDIVCFNDLPAVDHMADGAKSQLPPLLRTYLLMGGWVSDHAVIDRELNTMHVFTGVEIHAIPDGRKRLLRAVAD